MPALSSTITEGKIVEQGQIESVWEVQVGDNLVEKLQAAVLVRDGVIEAIEAG